MMAIRGLVCGRAALLTVLLLAGPAPVAAPAGAVQPSRSPGAGANRPSILLITIDTIRADGLPYAGYARNTAPFLSSLAARSLVFNRAYSTSSWTVPAVTSLVTGLYPRSHGVNHGVLRRGNVYDQEVLADGQPTLAEALRDAGYRTFGVAANAHLAPELGYGRGFDRYLCIGIAPADSVNATLGRWKAVLAAADGPVFIWLHYYDPHHPYVQNMPWFGDFLPGVTSKDGRLLMQAKASPPVMPRDPAARDRFVAIARALYDSEIRRVDEQIASLFREMPFLDGYMTVVTGDHGEEFLDHGNLTHCHNLYDETVRVPLLWRWPGDVGAGTGDALVSLVDVAPSLVTLAGGKPPATWSGRALFTAPGASPAVPDDRVIAADLDRDPTSGHQECAITSRYKFIRNLASKRNELYDLVRDPGEKTDLLPSDPATGTKLAASLDAFLKSLPPAPAQVARRPVTKQAEVELRGQGYIH